MGVEHNVAHSSGACEHRTLNLGKPQTLCSKGMSRSEKRPPIFFFFHGNPEIRRNVGTKSGEILKVQENHLKGAECSRLSLLNRSRWRRWRIHSDCFNSIGLKPVTIFLYSSHLCVKVGF